MVKFKVGYWKCLNMIFFAWQRGHPIILQRRLCIIHRKELPVRIHPHTGLGIHSQSYSWSCNKSWHFRGLYFRFPTIHSSCLKTYSIEGLCKYSRHLFKILQKLMVIWRCIVDSAGGLWKFLPDQQSHFIAKTVKILFLKLYRGTFPKTMADP